jgi:hypothetical protein
MIEDREQAEVAAEVIADLLYLIEPEKRLAALAIATKAEEAEQRKPGFEILDMGEIAALSQKEMRYWHGRIRFKARVICAFVRNIRNNHSPKDAARLLFQHQPNVPGSGYLRDYLDGLEGHCETIVSAGGRNYRETNKNPEIRNHPKPQ